MKKPAKIKIAVEIAQTISSRDIVQSLKDRIVRIDAQEVHLDFENVDRISRSAAHELLLVKKSLARRLLKRKKVCFINANESVSKMLDIVRSTQKSRKKRTKILDIQEVDFNSLQHFPTL